TLSEAEGGGGGRRAAGGGCPGGVLPAPESAPPRRAPRRGPRQTDRGRGCPPLSCPARNVPRTDRTTDSGGRGRAARSLGSARRWAGPQEWSTVIRRFQLVRHLRQAP